MMNDEPNVIVRYAVTQEITGTSSGSWFSHDPRPGLEHIERIGAMLINNPEEGYDFLVSLVEMAQASVQHEVHHVRAEMLYDLERIAEASDSFRLATYTHKLRTELYPGEQ